MIAKINQDNFNVDLRRIMLFELKRYPGVFRQKFGFRKNSLTY